MHRAPGLSLHADQTPRRALTHLRSAWLRWALVGAVVMLIAGQASGQGEQPSHAAADRAAVQRLRQAAVPTDQRKADAAIRALRYLQDPALRPFFSALAKREQPALRIHGLLGLAETRDPARLKLNEIAAVQDGSVQAELIGAALDNDLLQQKTMRKMLDWPGLPAGPKVLLAVRLIGDGGFEKTGVLRDALNQNNPRRRALAALLLHQIGELEEWQKQAKLGSLDHSQRRTAAITLLRVALEHRLDRSAPWAHQASENEAYSPRVQRLALRAAIRFGNRPSVATWAERFRRTTNPADRMRLALLGLRLSPWLEPGDLAPLAETGDPLFRKIASAGHAIARDDAELVDRVLTLIEANHRLINQWALSYADDQASPKHARFIFLGIILTGRHADEKTLARRLQLIAQATQLLYKHVPDRAPRLIRPLLEKHRDKPHLLQGMLLGLVRSRQPTVAKTIRSLKPFANLRAANLAVLARAGTDLPLTAADRTDLRTIVQGGGPLKPSLRVQAAWWYLKRTGRLKSALQRVLRETSPQP